MITTGEFKSILKNRKNSTLGFQLNSVSLSCSVSYVYLCIVSNVTMFVRPSWPGHC